MYLKKLGRGIISKVRTEIKHVDAQIRENERRTQVTRASIGKLQISIKKITEEIRHLAGPMSRMLRTVLRALGVELTIYWAGTFVGPQIAKLMDQDKYKYILENLEGAFCNILHKLTDEERNAGEQLLIVILQVFTAYFELLKRVKITHILSPCHIQDIECKVRNLSAKYRNLIPGPETPKFHEVEAHLVDSLKEFKCGWPYSEEAVESAHHWVRLFREKTSHVTGLKKKLMNFSEHWVTNQSKSGHNELQEIMDRGRQRRYAPRPNRKKKT